ncbi:hypothetical protein HMPREF6745_0940 [Prevotella sp. oral taxon 472 str. F0295]|nr:hypothetical protein HMPREF6745_0940 [Prevotella sp. oral taxon 472 str. F0295]
MMNMVTERARITNVMIIFERLLFCVLPATVKNSLQPALLVNRDVKIQRKSRLEGLIGIILCSFIGWKRVWDNLLSPFF